MINIGAVKADGVHAVICEVDGEQRKFGLDENGNPIVAPAHNQPANNEGAQIEDNNNMWAPWHSNQSCEMLGPKHERLDFRNPEPDDRNRD